MDFNKVLSTSSTTAEHNDPARAGVGTTAFGAAIGRACESAVRSRPPLVRDPVACAIFSFSTRPKEMPVWFCVLYFLWRWLPLTWPIFYFMKRVNRDLFKITDMIGMRTKFIDDSIAEAVTKQGVRQVVILGAGLDARAARLPALQPSSGATVFEVDFQGMIDAKRSMFSQVGFGPRYALGKTRGETVVSVGTDFSQPPERWKRDLTAAGFDQKMPSIWILEGLTGYLKRDELIQCFGTISSLSCPGSVLTATWNGESARVVPAPWTQNIHVSLVDDPAPLLSPFKWTCDKHVSVGEATKLFNIKDNIAATDKSYWFSCHIKE